MTDWIKIVNAIAVSTRNGGKWKRLSEGLFRSDDEDLTDVRADSEALKARSTDLEDYERKAYELFDEQPVIHPELSPLRKFVGNIDDPEKAQEMDQLIQMWERDAEGAPSVDEAVDFLLKYYGSSLEDVTRSDIIEFANEKYRAKPEKFVYNIGEILIDDSDKEWRIINHVIEPGTGLQFYQISSDRHTENGMTKVKRFLTQMELEELHTPVSKTIKPIKKEAPMAIRTYKEVSLPTNRSDMGRYINNLFNTSVISDNHLHITGTISEEFVWDKIRKMKKYDMFEVGDSSISDNMSVKINELKKQMRTNPKLQKILLPTGVNIDNWKLSDTINRYSNRSYKQLPKQVKGLLDEIFTYSVGPKQGTLTGYLKQFDVFKHTINTMDAYEGAIDDIITRVAKEAVNHIELKIPIDIVDKLEDIDEILDNPLLDRDSEKAYSIVYGRLNEAVEKANKKLDKPLSVKFTLNFSRSTDPNEILYRLKLIRAAMQRNPKLLKRISSVDGVAQELFVDPVTFKKVFDLVTNPMSKNGMGLKVLWHAGEDYVTIEDGINNIYRLLSVTKPSRLGHGIAIGAIPHTQYDARYEFFWPNYKDNPILSTIIAESREIIDERQKKLLLTKYKQADKYKDLSNNEIKKLPEYIEEVKELISQDTEYQASRGRPYTKKRYKEILKKQRELMDTLRKHHIAVEVAPSSNVSTGKLSDLGAHQVVRLWEGGRGSSAKGGKYRVPTVLISDTPLIVKTNTKKEYKKLYQIFAAQVDKDGDRIYDDDLIKVILKTIAVDSAIHTTDHDFTSSQKRKLNRDIKEIYGKNETLTSMKRKISKAQAKDIDIPQHAVINTTPDVDPSEYTGARKSVKHIKYEDRVRPNAVAALRKKQKQIEKSENWLRTGSLTSSSFAGNSHVIQYKIGEKQYNFLVDTGLKHPDLLVSKLHEAGIDPNTIHGIFVTHGHVDHVQSLRDFANRYPHIPVYITEGSYHDANRSIAERIRNDDKKVNENLVNYDMIKDSLAKHDEDQRKFRPVFIKPGQEIQLKIGGENTGIIVNPFKSSHDAADSVGYTFKVPNQSVAFMTDSGFYHDDIIENIVESKPTVMFLETNYDDVISMTRFHNDDLGVRIASDMGHSDNDGVARLIDRWAKDSTNIDELKTVHLIHGGFSNDPELAMLVVQRRFYAGVKQNFMDQGMSEAKAREEASRYINIKEPENGLIKFIWAPSQTISRFSVVGKEKEKVLEHRIQKTSRELDDAQFGGGSLNPKKKLKYIHSGRNIDHWKTPRIIAEEKPELVKNLPGNIALDHRGETKFLMATKMAIYDSKHLEDPADMTKDSNPLRFYDEINDMFPGISIQRSIDNRNGFIARELYWDKDYNFDTSKLRNVKIPEAHNMFLPSYEEVVYGQRSGLIKALLDTFLLPDGSLHPAYATNKDAIAALARENFGWGIRYRELDEELKRLKQVEKFDTGLVGQRELLRDMKAHIEMEMSYMRLEPEGLQWKLNKVEEARKVRTTGGLSNWTYADKQIDKLRTKAITTYNKYVEKLEPRGEKWKQFFLNGSKETLSEEINFRLASLELLSYQTRYASEYAKKHQYAKSMSRKIRDKELAYALYEEKRHLIDIDDTPWDEITSAYATRYYDAERALASANYSMDYYDEWAYYVSSSYKKTLEQMDELIEKKPGSKSVHSGIEAKVDKIRNMHDERLEEIKGLQDEYIKDIMKNNIEVDLVESRVLARYNQRINELSQEIQTPDVSRKLRELMGLKDRWLNETIRRRFIRNGKNMSISDTISSLEKRISKRSKKIDKIYNAYLESPEKAAELIPAHLKEEIADPLLYIDTLRADNEISTHKLNRMSADFSGAYQRTNILAHDDALLLKRSDDILEQNQLINLIEELKVKKQTASIKKQLVKARSDLDDVLIRIGNIYPGYIDSFTPVSLRVDELRSTMAQLDGRRSRAANLKKYAKSIKTQILNLKERKAPESEQFELLNKLQTAILKNDRLVDSDPIYYTHMIYQMGIDDRLGMIDNVVDILGTEVNIYDRDIRNTSTAIQMLKVGKEDIASMRGWMFSDVDQYVSRLPHYIMATKVDDATGKHVVEMFAVPKEWSKSYTNDLMSSIHAPDGVIFNLMSKRGIKHIPDGYASSALLIPEITDDGRFKYTLKNISSVKDKYFKDAFIAMESEASRKISKISMPMVVSKINEEIIEKDPDIKANTSTDGLLDKNHILNQDREITADSNSRDVIDKYRKQAKREGIRLDIEIDKEYKDAISDILEEKDLKGNSVYDEVVAEQARKPRFKWDRKTNIIYDNTHNTKHYYGKYIKYSDELADIDELLPSYIEHQLMSDLIPVAEALGYNNDKLWTEINSARDRAVEGNRNRSILDRLAHRRAEAIAELDINSFISKLNPEQMITEDSLPLLVSLDANNKIHVYRLPITKDMDLIDRMVDNGIGYKPYGHKFSFLLVEDESRVGYKLINRAGELVKDSQNRIIDEDVMHFRRMLDSAESVINALPWKKVTKRNVVINPETGVEFVVKTKADVDKLVSIEFKLEDELIDALTSQYISLQPKKYVMFKVAPNKHQEAKLLVEQRLGLRTLKKIHVIDTNQRFRWLDSNILEYDPDSLGLALKERPKYSNYVILELDELPENFNYLIHHKRISSLRPLDEQTGVLWDELSQDDVNTLIRNGDLKVADSIYTPQYLDEVITTQYRHDIDVEFSSTHGSNLTELIKTRDINQILEAEAEDIPRYSRKLESKYSQLRTDIINISTIIDRIEREGATAVVSVDNLRSEFEEYRKVINSKRFRDYSDVDKRHIYNRYERARKMLTLALSDRVEFDRQFSDALRSRLIELEVLARDYIGKIYLKDALNHPQQKALPIIDEALISSEVHAKDLVIRSIDRVQLWYNALNEMVDDPTEFAKELVKDRLIHEEDVARIERLGEEVAEEIRTSVEKMTDSKIVRKYYDDLTNNLFRPVTSIIKKLENESKDLFTLMKTTVDEDEVREYLREYLNIKQRISELKEVEGIQGAIRSVINTEKEIIYSAERKFVSDVIDDIVDLSTMKISASQLKDNIKDGWNKLSVRMRESDESLLKFFIDKIEDKFGKSTIDQKMRVLDVVKGKETIDGVSTRKKLDDLVALREKISRRLATSSTSSAIGRTPTLTALETKQLRGRLSVITKEIGDMINNGYVRYTTIDITPDIAKQLFTHLNKQKIVLGIDNFSPTTAATLGNLSEIIKQGDNISEARNIGLEAYKIAKRVRVQRNEMIEIYRTVDTTISDIIGMADVHSLMTRHYEIFAYNEIRKNIHKYIDTEIYDQMSTASNELRKTLMGDTEFDAILELEDELGDISNDIDKISSKKRLSKKDKSKIDNLLDQKNKKIEEVNNAYDNVLKRATASVNGSINKARDSVSKVGYEGNIGTRDIHVIDEIPKFEKTRFDSEVKKIENVLATRYKMSSAQVEALRPYIRNSIITNVYNLDTVLSTGFFNINDLADKTDMAKLADARLINIGTSKMSDVDIAVAQTSFHRNYNKIDLKLNQSVAENAFRNFMKVLGYHTNREDARTATRVVTEIFKAAGGSMRRNDITGKTMRLFFNENQLDEFVRHTFRTGFYGLLPSGINEYKASTAIVNAVKKVNNRVVPTGRVQSWLNKVIGDEGLGFVKSLLNGRVDMPRYAWIPTGFSPDWDDVIRNTIADIAMEHPEMSNKDILNHSRVQELLETKNKTATGSQIINSEEAVDHLAEKYGLYTITDEKTGASLRVTSKQRLQMVRIKDTGQFAIAEIPIILHQDGRIIDVGNAKVITKWTVTPSELPVIGKVFRWLTQPTNGEADVEIARHLSKLKERRDLLLLSDNVKKERIKELKARLTVTDLSEIDSTIINLSNQLEDIKAIGPTRYHMEILVKKHEWLSNKVDYHILTEAVEQLENNLKIRASDVATTLDISIDELNKMTNDNVLKKIKTKLLDIDPGYYSLRKKGTILSRKRLSELKKLRKEIGKDLDIVNKYIMAIRKLRGAIPRNINRLTKKVDKLNNIVIENYAKYRDGVIRLHELELEEIRSLKIGVNMEYMTSTVGMMQRGIQEEIDLLRMSGGELEGELLHLNSEINKFLPKRTGDILYKGSYTEVGFNENKLASMTTGLFRNVWRDLTADNMTHLRTELYWLTEKKEKVESILRHGGKNIDRNKLNIELTDIDSRIDELILRGVDDIPLDSAARAGHFFNRNPEASFLGRLIGRAMFSVNRENQQKYVDAYDRAEKARAEIFAQQVIKKRTNRSIIHNAGGDAARELISDTNKTIGRLLDDQFLSVYNRTHGLIDVLENIETLMSSIESKKLTDRGRKLLVEIRNLKKEIKATLSELNKVSPSIDGKYLPLVEFLLGKDATNKVINNLDIPYGVKKVDVIINALDEMWFEPNLSYNDRFMFESGVNSLQKYADELMKDTHELAVLSSLHNRASDMMVSRIRIIPNTVLRFAGGYPPIGPEDVGADAMGFQRANRAVSRVKKGIVWPIDTISETDAIIIELNKINQIKKLTPEQEQYRKVLEENLLNAIDNEGSVTMFPEDRHAIDAYYKYQNKTMEDIKTRELESRSNLASLNNKRPKRSLIELERERKLIESRVNIEWLSLKKQVDVRKYELQVAIVDEAEETIIELRDELASLEERYNKLDLNIDQRQLADRYSIIIDDINMHKYIRLEETRLARLRMEISGIDNLLKSDFHTRVRDTIDRLQASSLETSIDGDFYRMKTVLLQSQAEWIREEIVSKLGGKLAERLPFTAAINKLAPHEIAVLHNILIHTIAMDSELTTKTLSNKQFRDIYKQRKMGNFLPKTAYLKDKFSMVLLHEYNYDEMNKLIKAVDSGIVPTEWKSKYINVNMMKRDLGIRLEAMRREIVGNQDSFVKIDNIIPDIPELKSEFNIMLSKAARMSGLPDTIKLSDAYEVNTYTYIHESISNSKNGIVNNALDILDNANNEMFTAISAMNKDTARIVQFGVMRFNKIRDALDTVVRDNILGLGKVSRSIKDIELDVMFRLMTHWGPALRSVKTDTEAIKGLMGDFKDIWDGHVPERWREAADVEMREWANTTQKRIEGGMRVRFDNAIREFVKMHYVAETDNTSGVMSEIAKKRLNFKFKPRVDADYIKEMLRGLPDITLNGMTIDQYLEQMEIGYLSNVSDIVDKMKKDIRVGKTINRAIEDVLSEVGEVYNSNVTRRTTQVYHDFAYAISNQAMIDVYSQNSDLIRELMRVTREDERVCKYCGGHHLKRYTLDGFMIDTLGRKTKEPMIFLPQHGWCRCFYIPIFKNIEELRVAGLYEIYNVAKDNWGPPPKDVSEDSLRIVSDRVIDSITSRSRADNKKIYGSDQETILHHGGFGGGSEHIHKQVSDNIFIDATNVAIRKFAEGAVPELGKVTLQKWMKKAGWRVLAEYVKTGKVDPKEIIDYNEIKQVISEIDRKEFVYSGLRNVVPGTADDIRALIENYSRDESTAKFKKLYDEYKKNLAKGMGHKEALIEAMKETGYESEDVEDAADKFGGTNNDSVSADEAIAKASQSLTNRIMDFMWNAPKLAWDIFHPDYYDLLFSFVMADEERMFREISKETFGHGADIRKVAAVDDMVSAVAGGTMLSMVHGGYVAKGITDMASSADDLVKRYQQMPQFSNMSREEITRLPAFLTDYKSIQTQYVDDISSRYITENQPLIGDVAQKINRSSDISPYNIDIESSSLYGHIKDKTREADHLTEAVFRTRGNFDMSVDELLRMPYEGPINRELLTRSMDAITSHPGFAKWFATLPRDEKRRFINQLSKRGLNKLNKNAKIAIEQYYDHDMEKIMSHNVTDMRQAEKIEKLRRPIGFETDYDRVSDMRKVNNITGLKGGKEVDTLITPEGDIILSTNELDTIRDMEMRYEQVHDIGDRSYALKRQYHQVKLVPEEDGRLTIKIVNLDTVSQPKSDVVNHVLSSLEDAGLPTITNTERTNMATSIDTTMDKVEEYIDDKALDQSKILRSKLLKDGEATTSVNVLDQLNDVTADHVHAKTNINKAMESYIRSMDIATMPVDIKGAENVVRSMVSKESLYNMEPDKLYKYITEFELDANDVQNNRVVNSMIDSQLNLLKRGRVSQNRKTEITSDIHKLRSQIIKSEFSDISKSDLKAPEVRDTVIDRIYKRMINNRAKQLNISRTGLSDKQLEDKVVGAYVATGDIYHGDAINTIFTNMLLADPILRSIDVTPHQIRRVMTRHGTRSMAWNKISTLMTSKNRRDVRIADQKRTQSGIRIGKTKKPRNVVIPNNNINLPDIKNDAIDALFISDENMMNALRQVPKSQQPDVILAFQSSSDNYGNINIDTLRSKLNMNLNEDEIDPLLDKGIRDIIKGGVKSSLKTK